MVEEAHYAILKEGRDSWNEWRHSDPTIIPDLTNIDFVQMDDVDSDFTSYDFFGVNFSGSSLVECNFTGASFRQAILTDTDLSDSHFQRAKFNQARLKNCRMFGSDFAEADFSEALLESCLAGVTAITTDHFETEVTESFLVPTIFYNATMNEIDINNLIIGYDQSAEEAVVRSNYYYNFIYDNKKTESEIEEFQEYYSDTELPPLDIDFVKESGFITGVDFRSASLKRAKIKNVRVTDDDLSVDFRESDLRGAQLSDVNLASIHMWGTRFDDWVLSRFICPTVFWDEDALKPERYSPDEFSRAFASKQNIKIQFPGGMSTVDLITLPLYIQQLQNMYPGTTLQIRSIEDVGAGACVTVTVESQESSSEANLEEEITKIKASIDEIRESASSNEIAILDATKNMMKELIPIVMREAKPYKQVAYFDRNATVNMVGRDMSGDQYKSYGQTSGFGPHASSTSNEFHQIWNANAAEVDLGLLAVELDQLRETMRQHASNEEHDISIGEVAAAQKAAAVGDGPKTISHLQKAGSWAFDISNKVGIGVATAAVKNMLGL